MIAPAADGCKRLLGRLSDTRSGCLDAPHSQGHRLVTTTVTVQQASTATKVVEPSVVDVGLCGTPVEAMLFDSRIVATHLTTAAQYCVETGNPSAKESGVRGLAIILGIPPHAAIALRQLTPFIVCRQAPPSSQ